MDGWPKSAARALGYFARARREERRTERAFAPFAPHLRPCTRIWGGTEIEGADPAVELHRGAIYVPRAPTGGAHVDTAWGLYEAHGPSITRASYRRGPGPVPVGQSPATALRAGDVARAPDAPYIYGGTLHRHYGHFLLSGLAWLWPRLHDLRPGTRIVYHGDDDPEALWRYPFIADCLSALEIGPGDLVRFDAPTALPEILVPGPSYEETYRAHAVHGRLGAAIGAKLLGAAPREIESRPVFLARDRLPTGVRRFVDEAEIVERLARAGVRIVRPETLSLAEQIRVFDAHPLVIGSLGSALHTSLLAPARSAPTRLLAIHHERAIPSNFAMIDRLKGQRSDYVYPGGRKTMVDLALTHFQVEFRIDDLPGTLDALMRLVDARMAETARS